MAITTLTPYSFTDGFGNFYINSKNINNNNAYNSLAATNISASSTALNTDINTALSGFYGNRIATNTTGNTFSILFNHPFEPLSPPANTSGVRRITAAKFYNGASYVGTQINTSTNSSSQMIAAGAITTSTFSASYLSTSWHFITCNATSINQFHYDALLRRLRFRSIGWAYQSTNTTSPFAGVYDLYIESGYGTSSQPNIETFVQYGFITTSTNTTSVGARVDMSTATPNGYVITCADGQNPTRPWVTNQLLLAGGGSPPDCWGIMSGNLLRASADYNSDTFFNDFEVGRMYKINNVGENLDVVSNRNSNPNTDCPYYICVGNWGSEKLLMRICAFGFN